MGGLPECKAYGRSTSLNSGFMLSPPFLAGVHTDLIKNALFGLLPCLGMELIRTKYT